MKRRRTVNRKSSEIGKEGERLAAVYLESKGWTILDRNYSFQRAEVDLVAYDNRQIVFVEVKRRSRTDYGYPEDPIDERKIRMIYKAAEAWMYERRMEGSPTRFDVISIVQKGNEAPDIRHIENAFP